jgi:hypothetical protein
MSTSQEALAVMVAALVGNEPEAAIVVLTLQLGDAAFHSGKHGLHLVGRALHLADPLLGLFADGLSHCSSQATATVIPTLGTKRKQFCDLQNRGGGWKTATPAQLP